MARQQAHFQGKEPFLESKLRALRLRKIIRHIPAGAKVVDLGCGYDYYFLHSIVNQVQQAVAIDLSVQPSDHPKIQAIAHNLNTRLPLPSEQFDIVVSMANLEHLSQPLVLLGEVQRILKPGGKLILTTPTTYAKLVLEFLSYRLHLISEAEIRDHKMYFNRQILQDYLQRSGFSQPSIQHRYFQWYMNNFIIAEK